jgi:formamidopyrimidine-DNA glycosylase
MPELPEVECVRRGLEPALVGARIGRVEVRRPDLRFPFPPRFAERLTGRQVRAIERRSKYLLVRLDNAESLVLHLGMSGRFVLAENQLGTYVHTIDRLACHDHVIIETLEGARIVYNDPRRFGFMLLIRDEEIARHELFAKLGIEPLSEDLTPQYLRDKAAGRRCDLKAFLMDQHVIAGLGNIYVCEALFRAGLAPTRVACCLSEGRGAHARAVRLVQAVHDVLIDAVAAGGSTLRDWRKADGSEGQFSLRHAVYGREDEACRRDGCTGRIRRVNQAQRSSFYCPKCQR